MVCVLAINTPRDVIINYSFIGCVKVQTAAGTTFSTTFKKYIMHENICMYILWNPGKWGSMNRMELNITNE